MSEQCILKRTFVGGDSSACEYLVSMKDLELVWSKNKKDAMLVSGTQFWELYGVTRDDLQHIYEYLSIRQ